MNGYLFALLVVAMLLVFGTLAIGLISFARGGENAPQRSNLFMRYRVVFQGIAVLVVVILMLLAKD
jgi:hypothetical protein